MPIEISREKTQEQADILEVIAMHIAVLDAEYLEACLVKMEGSHAFRHSAAVLDPNPFTHNERQDLEALSLKQFRLYLDLRKNMDEIGKAKIALNQAKDNTMHLSDIFGL